MTEDENCFGWCLWMQYVVVDFLWYRKNETGASVHGGTDIIDQWGRLQPDPTRWPSSKGGLGFSLVAERVHSLGLKFGIHVMRGISLAAVQANTSILGTEVIYLTLRTTSHAFVSHACILHDFLRKV